MPTHQQSMDEDKTLTDETQAPIGEQPIEENLKSVVDTAVTANGADFGAYDDEVDITLKSKEHQHNVTTPLLAKIIVESTYSALHTDQGQQVSDHYANGTCNYSEISQLQQEVLYAELNDVVHVEEQIDEKWFLAKSDQTSGKLRIDSCRILDSEIPSALCRYLLENHLFELHVCFASFVAQDVGDLSLTKGDIVVAIRKVNEHWLQGQVCFDGQANSWPKLEIDKQIGSFPLNHCWELDAERIEQFCRHRIEIEDNQSHSKVKLSQWSSNLPQLPTATHYDISNHMRRLPFLSTAHSSSLSSRSSSAFSTTDNQFTSNNKQYKYYDITDNSSQNSNNTNINNNYTSQSNYNINQNINSMDGKPPPRPMQLPSRQLCQSYSSNRLKSASDQAVVVKGPSVGDRNLITNKQQDRLKGWLHTVRKKTARLSTRITASLGLISLPRDEEFERHHESFKQLEKTVRNFIKNISAFVEHYESFLIALQHTSDNLSDFYRDKSQNQKELAELKRKNKVLHCEHFHAFKRTVERQVIAVASQLLQKFAGPHQLISKRSAKLIDYNTKTKEMESCRDLEKKAVLHDQYLVAKDLYDRLNGQLIQELSLFNQFALDIFRECILVLLESRRSLILSYTKQTANLLKTPLMASYTASDVTSSIMMSCSHQRALDQQEGSQQKLTATTRLNNTEVPNDIRAMLNEDKLVNNRQMSTGTQPSGSSGGDAPFSDGTSTSRPHSAMSQLSSDFDQINEMVAREISSTPLSQISVSQDRTNASAGEPVDEHAAVSGHHRARIDISRISNGSSDNRHNEGVESRIEVAQSKPYDLGSIPPQPPQSQAVADSDLDENVMQQLKSHLSFNGNGKSKRKNKKMQPVYIASWPFVATGPNQLTIACNQQLKLVKDSDECGNADWSLVKDKRGHLGYVPSSYIKKRE